MPVRAGGWGWGCRRGRTGPRGGVEALQAQAQLAGAIAGLRAEKGW